MEMPITKIPISKQRNYEPLGLSFREPVSPSISSITASISEIELCTENPRE